MKDFTLYLHDIDAPSFDLASSRYNTSRYHEEWLSAYDDYRDHVDNYAPTQQLKDFAGSEWRQDLSDIRCIRNCYVEPIIFSSHQSDLIMVVQNHEYGKNLTFSYLNVEKFAWQGLGSDEDLGLELEELRFEPSSDIIEHEIRFYSSSLLIRAHALKIDIDDYLNQ